MYSIKDEHIDFILHDLTRRGIETEDLKNNLLDHLCCMIENELEENGDFHSFYTQLICRFYKSSLAELEEETKSLLIFKNYYEMKKVMLITGVLAAALLSTGIVFKFLHLAGAAAMLVSGVFFLSFLFLPLMFILKIRENSSMKDKALIAVAAVAAVSMSLAPIFKIMHWPGANMLGMSAVGILVLIFLPVYFFTGIRNQETKVNTIISSILIIAGVGLFLSLIRSPHATMQQNISETATFFRNNELYEKERLMLAANVKQDSMSLVSRTIDAICEEVKISLVQDQTGMKKIDEKFAEKNAIIADDLVENYFFTYPESTRRLEQLRKLISDYNNSNSGNHQMTAIPVEMTVLDTKQEKVVRALNDLVQIQLIVLQNERLKSAQ